MKKMVTSMVSKIVCVVMVAVVFVAAVPAEAMFESAFRDCPYLVSPNHDRDRELESDS